jgi:nuclear pore complex protein Nup93
VDASTLARSIAHLNTATTFSPLQPLQDTDVAGYLRHAHEQNLISTIEEGRKETQTEFYRVLEERCRKEWETKKKRVFEELGGRVGGNNKALAELKKSSLGRSGLMVQFHRNVQQIWVGSTLSQASTSSPSISLQMQNKMMAYEQVISALNTARLHGSSFPIAHALIDASVNMDIEVRGRSACAVYFIDTLCRRSLFT